jgi:hypothetical protein
MIKSLKMRRDMRTIYTYIDPTSLSLIPFRTQKWSVQNACYAWYRFARQMPPLFPLLFPRLHSYSYMCLFFVPIIKSSILDIMIYFLLFITLVHISTSPSFASLSGNPEMASIALSTYSCARTRVCSRPVLFDTISRAYPSISHFPLQINISMMFDLPSAHPRRH